MLNAKALAIAIGTVWGAYAMFTGWMAAYGWGAELVNTIGTLYIGYAPGFLGGIIGGIWGFVDGAIAGLVIAFLYNRIAKKS